MAGDPSDVELMLKVKRGDRDAFSVLVRRYRKPLINFVYRFTTDPAVSEDLTHEVFLKAFQAASKYEPTAGFSTWLYRIATNAALNHIRDHKPQLS
jgi:RNA polymerase sigma-70 factor (ECF subfamily)